MFLVMYDLTADAERLLAYFIQSYDNAPKLEAIQSNSAVWYIATAIFI